jgi:adenylate cyclase
MTDQPTESGRPSGDAVAIRAVLSGLGVDDGEIEAAERTGTLAFLAIERLVLPDPAVYNLDEVSAVTGMPTEQIVQLWRSLGYPDPSRRDRLFTETDAEMLRTVAELTEEGFLAPDLAVQMSRVIGSSLARVASAMIDTFGRDLDTKATADEEFAVYAGTLLPTMPKVMDYVWRRHLQAAARRRLTREAQGDAQPDHTTVGFADLVGFTALSQQLDEHQLAHVVDRFEAIAYDTVVLLGGRVVKMIGDEVMFVVDDVRAAAEIALALSEAYRSEDSLSDVRVGLASGPALEREADYYGPVVNMASRIVNIAFPGSVVVDESVHAALEDDPAFSWRFLKHRRLKDIGRVPLWALRRADEEEMEPTRRDQARRRHAEQREREVERLAGGRPSAGAERG